MLFWTLSEVYLADPRSATSPLNSQFIVFKSAFGVLCCASVSDLEVHKLEQARNRKVGVRLLW